MKTGLLHFHMRLEFALRPAENCARKGGITDFPGKEGNHGGEPARREICTVPCRGGLYIRPRALSTTQPGTGAYAMRPYRCAAMSRPHRVCTLSTSHMAPFLLYILFYIFIYMYCTYVLRMASKPWKYWVFPSTRAADFGVLPMYRVLTPRERDVKKSTASHAGCGAFDENLRTGA